MNLPNQLTLLRIALSFLLIVFVPNLEAQDSSTGTSGPAETVSMESTEAQDAAIRSQLEETAPLIIFLLTTSEADLNAQRGPEGGLPINTLKKALKDRDWQIRSSAACVLGKVGPESKKAVPDLIQALEDQNKHVRYFAAKALETIGTPKALEAVKQYRDKGAQ